jgi:DNA polymerase-3 subunit alpha
MRGQEPIEYRHPRLEPILSKTFGILVYQEQIMRVAIDLAGYTPSEADELRKVVAKKKGEAFPKQRAKFLEGCVRNGIPAEVAEAIWGDIEFFARYGFNAAHAASYAKICVQTAYLKAKYPVEYLCALMTVDRNKTEKLGLYVAECRRLGIPVLPPDINRSEATFTIERTPEGVEAIRFGLTAVKNVGEGAVARILAARREGGPFRDLDDLARRVDLKEIGRRALESLIRVGALSAFGNRAQLLEILDRLMEASARYHRERQQGMLSLFDLSGLRLEATSLVGALPNLPEVEEGQILEWEKELVGAYLSETPLTRQWPILQQVVTHTTADLSEELHGQTVKLAGLIRAVRTVTTRTGETMAYVTMEDIHGMVEVVIFPRLWKQKGDRVRPDSILIVVGKAESGGREPRVVAEDLRDQEVLARPVEEQTETEAEGFPEAEERILPPNGWERSREETASDPKKAAPSVPPSSSEETPSPPSEGEAGAWTPASERGQQIPPGPETPRAVPARQIVVYLYRTDRLEDDLRRLQEVHRLLTERPGPDPFQVVVVYPDRRQVRLRFPQQGTWYSPELLARLEGLLGPDSVRVFPLKPQE